MTFDTKQINDLIGKLLNKAKKYNIKLMEPNKEVFDKMEIFGSKYLVRKIYANRIDNVDELIKIFGLEFKTIMTEEYLKQLPDIDKAADTIYKHIKNNDKILIVTDYDVDGVTSAAIMHLFLLNVLDYSNFDVIVNKREYNNGINDTIRDIIIKYCNNDNNIKLMITGDHGSSDRTNYKKIREKTGIDIVVTDHHLFDDNLAPDPDDVNAFVNPQRTVCDFNEMSGAGISYFTFLYTALKYFKDKLDKSKWDLIYYYLTYIGLTIISDSRSMKDPLNRKITRKALNIINSKRTKHNTFWKTVISKLESSYFIDETKLSYEIIPHLNTPGRIGDPYYSYLFLVTDDELKSEELYSDIENLNDTRKERQNSISDTDKKIEFKNNMLYVSYIKNAHNLQGIIANKYIYDSNKYQVAFIFSNSPSNPNKNIYIGSGRSKSSDISIKAILDKIAKEHNIIVKHGGHDSAVGIEIEGDIETFFNILSKELEKYNNVRSSIEVDDVIISNKKLMISLLDIKDSGPYGVKFPKPMFLSEFIVTGYKIFKNKYLVMYVRLSKESDYTVRLMYTIKKDELEEVMYNLKYKKKILSVYTISVDTYMNTNKVILNSSFIKFMDDE